VYLDEWSELQCIDYQCSPANRLGLHSQRFGPEHQYQNQSKRIGSPGKDGDEGIVG
jgi:hypothetical protein